MRMKSRGAPHYFTRKSRPGVAPGVLPLVKTYPPPPAVHMSLNSRVATHPFTRKSRPGVAPGVLPLVKTYPPLLLYMGLKNRVATHPLTRKSRPGVAPGELPLVKTYPPPPALYEAEQPCYNSPFYQEISVRGCAGCISVG